jgi:hypothetical protein
MLKSSVTTLNLRLIIGRFVWHSCPDELQDGGLLQPQSLGHFFKCAALLNSATAQLDGTVAMWVFGNFFATLRFSRRNTIAINSAPLGV